MVLCESVCPGNTNKKPLKTTTASARARDESTHMFPVLARDLIWPTQLD